MDQSSFPFSLRALALSLIALIALIALGSTPALALPSTEAQPAALPIARDIIALDELSGLPIVEDFIEDFPEDRLIEPSFWAALMSTLIDYTPWTADEYRSSTADLFASVLGYFSLSHRYRISSLFGPRFHPVLKRQRNHNGIDMAAPTGTPVRAAQDGVIEHADWRGGYGKFVEIDHKGPWETGYAHLSAITVLPGTEVERGDPIGLVGTTGRSTGPHLHFVVKKDGVAVDPLIAQGFRYISPIVPLSYNLLKLKLKRRDEATEAKP